MVFKTTSNCEYKSYPFIYLCTNLKDNSRIVHVPPIKDIPAHRPISILNCLEQMYGQNEGEESEKEEKLPQHGTFEQIGEVCCW
jgi:hypothetical protein